MPGKTPHDKSHGIISAQMITHLSLMNQFLLYAQVLAWQVIWQEFPLFAVGRCLLLLLAIHLKHSQVLIELPLCAGMGQSRLG